MLLGGVGVEGQTSIRKVLKKSRPGGAGASLRSGGGVLERGGLSLGWAGTSWGRGNDLWSGFGADLPLGMDCMATYDEPVLLKCVEENVSPASRTRVDDFREIYPR